MRDTTTSLLHSRIIVYQIDPEGLGVQQGPPVLGGARSIFTAIGAAGPQHRSQAVADEITLSTFASQTGGRYLFNRNDVDVAVSDSIADLQHSYAISYSPENLVRDGKYRTIKIKINRPGLTVQTRDGYFAPGGDAATLPQHESEFEMSKAASNSMYYSGVSARIDSIVPSKTPGAVDIVVRVKTKDLEWKVEADGKTEATFFIAAIAQSATRKILKSHVRRVVIAMPDAQAGVQQPTEAKVTIDLPLLDQAPYLRVLVHDAGGRLGSADVDPAVIASLRTQMTGLNSQAAPAR